MNSKDLYIIADCSGSFKELGKDSIQEYLLRTISNQKKLFKKDYDINFKVYIFNENVLEFKSFKSLTFNGTISELQMVDFLESLPFDSKILFVSDGSLSNKVKKSIIDLKNKKDFFIIPVSVGFDAKDLKNISSIDKSFPTEDIINALNVACFMENNHD